MPRAAERSQSGESGNGNDYRFRSDRVYLERLTPREVEIVELLVEGVTTDRALSERLVVSPNTIKYHLRNILGKLRVENRAQVIAYVHAHGLPGD